MSRVFGGTLLVAGTCIGAGMLGLPVATAAGGFYYTTLFFLICWLIMTSTAFMMLEVSLCHPEETNLISMVNKTLGPWAKGLTWVIYLLFLYAIMATYTSGGMALTAQVFETLGFPKVFSDLLFLSFFAGLVYLGARWVDGVNRIFMVALIFAYFALVTLGTPEVDFHHFEGGQPQFLLAAMPLMVTSFGFHLLIPTLKTYFQNDVRRLRFSIFFGSLIPLMVYLLWEFIILGVIPKDGAQGLIAMVYEGQPAVHITSRLKEIVSSNYVGPIAQVFSYFALVSSFVGVALGLFDFLADGTHIQKNKRGRLALVALTFLPPTLFVLFYPKAFLLTLAYAGVFAAILLIILPALMVYVGRYHRDIKRPYEMAGGRLLPCLAIAFGCLVIALHILQELQWLPQPMIDMAL